MLVQVEADQAGDLPPVPGEELLAQAVPQAGTPPRRDQGRVVAAFNKEKALVASRGLLREIIQLYT